MTQQTPVAVAAVDFVPLPARLRASAQRHPDALAVIDAGKRLSYSELRDAAHRLAHLLLRLGAAPGDAVAVCLPRGADAVVAQAAVLAAGLLYVPVDADQPAEFFRHVLTTTAVRHIIGYSADLAGCVAKLGPEADAVTGIAMDDPDELAQLAACPTHTPKADLAPGDPAYVIHTSGSSGAPKGVLVNHGAIANSTSARLLRYPESVERFLLVSPMTFDPSLAGLWWTLSCGGTLRIPKAGAHHVLDELRTALTDSTRAVSHVLLTPSLYRRALDGVPVGSSGPSRVIVGGEPCPAELVTEHYRRFPDAILTNEYGPAEAAVWCTAADLAPGADVVIGTPIAGVEVLVLDDQGRPVPTGTMGELGIAGTQLADGYLGNPELTAEKFQPHPLRGNERIYRSGDLGRLRPDGQLEIFGRLDDQVKVRGYRVDLQGVAAQLRRHPGVRDVAVLLRERPYDASERMLTAYVVPEADLERTGREQRSALAGVVDDIAANAPARGSDFDTSGWISSYTRAPLPDPDMREWVDRTVRLLSESRPKTVLELGCGSGMLLLRLAPDTRRYVGLDISAAVLDGLRTAVDRAGLRQVVELVHGEAVDAERFHGAQFDLVACNSVTQYFADTEYLRRATDAAIHAAGGGRVVFGDVRDQSLLGAFHACVVFTQAGLDTPGAELARRWRRRMAEEAQMLVDPQWFTGYARQSPGVAQVEIRPRRGRRRNEMNDFRFDVVLHTRPRPGVDIDRWLDWPRESPDTRTLRQLLETRPETLGMLRIPNRRTAAAAALAAELATGADWPTVELHDLQRQAEAKAIDPEDLIDLAEELGYRCHLSRASAAPDGAFDAAFTRIGASHDVDAVPRFPTAPAHSRTMVTEPVRQRIVADARGSLLPALRRHAEASLPVYERPAAYVAIPELPLTHHDKVDAAALPEPEVERPQISTPFTAPNSETQTAVAAIWAELLGIDRVGAHDDFVELGGDSLLAARCAVRLSESFGVRLPAGIVFTAPTVARVARVIEDRFAGADTSSGPTADGMAPSPRRPTPRLPLTSSQSVFWFLDHYRRLGGSRNPDFALPVHYRISGPVDTAALRDAVDTLVARHQALRTAVHLDAADGYQTVNEARPGTLMVHTLDADDPEKALREAAGRDDRRPLDPGTGAVFTVDLISASHTEHLLIVRVHHMVCDGWALDVLEQELGELYHARRTGRAARLGPPPNYADHVYRTDERFFVDLGWRDCEPYRSALGYWERYTVGAEPIFLTDQHNAGSRRTETCGVILPAHEAQALLAVGRAHQATLFASLLTCLAPLLAADSDDPNVRLLTLNAARDEPGLDRMVGLLIDPVLIRVPAPSGSSFGDLLRHTSEMVRQTLANSDVPLLALCEQIPELMTVTMESQFVAFECLPPVRGLDLDGCQLRRSDPFEPDFAGTSFDLPVDLLLVARPEADTVRLVALYDPDTFPAEYVRALLTRLRDLAANGAANPSVTVDSLVAADPWMADQRHRKDAE
ncbi:non-ribosomal peptide synthetase [Kibdelosporangium aridum]|uniref:Non-ribosomal peptide synthetase n=1 Tax=Kibdelosporangium aridum TaxID=2030 RepID=A0A428YC12_KIBAR|nr:non-ribosomal peptide synthetase [Kibdelosporangium aridum]RSM65091.1 non-ribosomal peptide synthetase [Kibdelosporangium aridum]